MQVRDLSPQHLRGLRAAVLLLLPLLFASPLPAQERIDYDMVTRIRQEGFRNSHVMETASAITDGIGARLTGSPQMKRANEWTRDRLAQWGLANPHLESWGPFGRGWSYEAVSVRMIAPVEVPLVALPKAWSRGTDGPVRGPVVLAKLTSPEDFEKQKGKLKGRIVLSDYRDIRPPEKPSPERYDEKALEELWEYEVPAPRDPDEYRRRREFRRALNEFLEKEQPLAVIDPGTLDAGIFRVQQNGSGWKKDEPVGVPSLVMEVEHYGRIVRLLEAKKDVELEIDVRARFHDDDPMSYNTVAEIPGAEKSGQIVMLLRKKIDVLRAVDQRLHPVHAGALQRLQLEGWKRDDALEGLLGEGGAKGRWNGHPALPVDLVHEGIDEQCHDVPS